MRTLELPGNFIPRGCKPQHKHTYVLTDIPYKDVQSTVQKNQVCKQQECPPTGCPSTEEGIDSAVFTRWDALQKCKTGLLVPGKGLSLIWFWANWIWHKEYVLFCVISVKFKSKQKQMDGERCPNGDCFWEKGHLVKAWLGMSLEWHRACCAESGKGSRQESSHTVAGQQGQTMSGWTGGLGVRTAPRWQGSVVNGEMHIKCLAVPVTWHTRNVGHCDYWTGNCANDKERKWEDVLLDAPVFSAPGSGRRCRSRVQVAASQSRWRMILPRCECGVVYFVLLHWLHGARIGVQRHTLWLTDCLEFPVLPTVLHTWLGLHKYTVSGIIPLSPMDFAGNSPWTPKGRTEWARKLNNETSFLKKGFSLQRPCNNSILRLFWEPEICLSFSYKVRSLPA